MAVARSGGRPPNRLAGPAPVAESAPAPIRIVYALPAPCAATPAAEPPLVMSVELEALPREKKRKRKRHGERAEAAAFSSESPPPPLTPESKPEALTRAAPETLAPAAAAPVPAMRGGKECRRKHLEAAPPASPLLAEEEAVVRKEEKKRKRKNRGEAAPATPSSSTAAAAQILEVESKAAAEGETARKKKRRRPAVEKEQEQSGQPLVPVRVCSQGREQAADGGNSGVQSSKPRHGAPSDLEIIRLRKELRKQQPGFVPAVTDPYAFAQDPKSQDPKYSSPFGAFFDQFCYKPDRKRRNHGEAAPATPLPSTAAAAEILEVESKVAAEGETARKKKRRRPVVEQEQEQSGQPPVPIRVCSQGGEQAADGGNIGVQSSKPSTSKKHRAPSDLEIIRLRKELRKQQPGFVPAVTDHYAFAQDPKSQDPKYSSPFGAFFDQFCYKPDRPQDRNAPQPPKSPDRAARPPPCSRPSSGSSLLNANRTSKAAKTTALNAKRRCSASASTPGSQNNVKLEVMEKPKRKPALLLTAAEKRSEKYRRLPLDQLVPPPRSPHRLLQEKYASDPWKVVVICMLLNLTQGKQVKRKVKGFFRRYSDAQTACAADPEDMAEYLKPLGLQHVKTKNIQKFSKAYVEEKWTYITELCGVGKYAADAYAIFCAGRAKEVVPKDHKLVDYWKYVCFELPSIQTPQNEQDSAGVTGLGNVVVEA